MDLPTISITGCRYARLTYGPVPEQFEQWLAALLREDAGFQKEEVWSNDCPGEVFIYVSPPDLTIFSPSELKVLAIVKEKFHDFSARKISDFSHSEKGYQETDNSGLISYSYAGFLQI